jgi:hypothetical protein
MTPNAYADCLASSLAVSGGQIDGLSSGRTPCQTAERVVAAEIANLAAGLGTGGGPTRVDGWTCLSYDGNEVTCTRGHATVYAQFSLS